MKTFKLALKWIALMVLTAIVVGSLSAFFLISLEFTTSTRESSKFWVYLLPIGGFLAGLAYYRLGKGIEGDNNRVIAEMVKPNQKIHWKMSPMILFGTLASHLFGASVGREGTAVQMGAASADQWTSIFNLEKKERQVLLRMGVAAGFASIFGTPIAGFFFALEMARDKIFSWYNLLVIAVTAYLGDLVCHLWEVHHTEYFITEVPRLSFISFGWTLLSALCFGLTSLVFNISKKKFGSYFTQFISYPPLRLAAAGALTLIFVLVFNTTDYLGLGVPIIQNAFTEQNEYYVFLVKLLLTALALGAGFKGGEATPIFFMGATLGSALFGFIDLPLSLLAGLGFIAVFAGSTNTPLACIAMGGELFGWEGFPYYIVVCFVAYFISGQTSVYSEQVNQLRKYDWLRRK